MLRQLLHGLITSISSSTSEANPFLATEIDKMALKMSMAALAGAHTAGIYADMTVDGPDIGDLVVILDKAKNLPNRKTIGKQDPYCAARLGKEAKKTETDKRGGQTPRWYVVLEAASG